MKYWVALLSSGAVLYLLLAIFSFLISASDDNPYEMHWWLFLSFMVLSYGIAIRLWKWLDE